MQLHPLRHSARLLVGCRIDVTNVSMARRMYLAESVSGFVGIITRL